jgi:hypothetical protein
MNTKSDLETRPVPDADRRFFTIDEANRALAYVSRIAHDIQESYRQATALQERLDHDVPADDVETIRGDYEQAIARLNRYVEELHDVGVELKDYEAGLIDFPAMHEGREICLCWRSGEDHIHAWHELHAGFAGRQELAALTPARPAKGRR